MIAVYHDLNPLNPGKLGSLKAMSPEEPRHALIFAIARDIDCGMSDEQLMPWKVLIASAILTFQKVDNEDGIFGMQPMPVNHLVPSMRLSTSAR
jgi:hypothetical protein